MRVTGPDGTVLAESTAALLVSETSLPDRFYFPRGDVQVDLAPSERTWTCPYKGHATYWSVAGAEDVAWSYETPLAGVAAARRLRSRSPATASRSSELPG